MKEQVDGGFEPGRKFCFVGADMEGDFCLYAKRQTGEHESKYLKEDELEELAEQLNKQFEHVIDELESCPKCGARVLRSEAYPDEGTGDESGRTFYYCSERCRETH